MDKTWAPLKTGNTSTHTCFNLTQGFLHCFLILFKTQKVNFPQYFNYSRMKSGPYQKEVTTSGPGLLEENAVLGHV